jgi:PleD family two-component response regulator
MVDYPDSAAIQDAIAKADTQLYRAKKAGKARIEAR